VYHGRCAGKLVVMLYMYCWGSQHSNNGLRLAIASMSLNTFMSAYF
jgi:hypothetical protein